MAGVGAAAPAPVRVLQSVFYSRWVDAADWDARYRDRPGQWGTEPPTLLADLLGPLASGSAVDLACGQGRVARWLAGRGWAVTGVDFSGVAVDAARAGDPGRMVDWQVGDARTWEPGAPVDLVVLAYLHLPLPELAGVLGRAASWLRPGGRLVYLGHAAENLRHGVGGPADPAVLPGVADLARGFAGLRVLQLRHATRGTAAGTAVDVVGVATRWAAPPP